MTPQHLQKLFLVFNRWLYLTSHESLQVIAATYLANRLEGARLWMCLVGPSSCGKTTLAESLLGLPNVHQINSLTTGAFASGHVTKDNPSARFGLFQTLSADNHLLVVPDFSSILRKDPKVRGEIFGQLRSIYDGSWKQTFGTGVEIDWKGSIGILACTTPNFEREISSEGAFGERFLYWKMPPLDPFHVGERSLRNSERTDELRRDLRKAMTFLSKLPLSNSFRLPLGIRNVLARQTAFVALARTPILRDPYSKEIVDIPRSESTARISQQLGQLLKGLLVLHQASEVSEEMMEIVETCAYACIPDIRLRLIAFASGKSFDFAAAKTSTRLPGALCRRTLEDLTLLGMLKVERGAKVNSFSWKASDEYIPFFRRIKSIFSRLGY